MPPQIRDLVAGTGTGAMQQIGIGPFILLLSVSLAGSLLAALLYVHFYSSRATGSQVYRAFPLLGLSITAIFVCIQFSLPLSLGLLGALSIVRFRTPIKEPEEVAFIMLVVAASIATATFKLTFVALLFGVAIVALLVQTAGGPFAKERRAGTLVVTVPQSASTAQTSVSDSVRRNATRAKLESLTHHDQTLVLSFAFDDVSTEALGRLQSELPALAPGLTYSLFFTKPGPA